MKTVVLAFAGALLLASAPAVAEPVTLTQTIIKDGFAKLRRHCDQQGRCWTEGHRNLLLDSYALAPLPPWYRPVKLAAKPAVKKVATKPARAAPREAMARMR
jgi:hypothetical protein